MSKCSSRSICIACIRIIEILYNEKANIGHAGTYDYVDSVIFGGSSWAALEAAYQNTLHRIQINYEGTFEKYASKNNGASWTNEGTVPTFVSYFVPLENGWGGNLLVILSKFPSIAIIKGVLDPTNATDDAFAVASADPDDSRTNYRIPVPHQGARLFVNQDLLNIKMTFAIGSLSQWYATIDRSTIGAPVSICNVYATV